MHLQGTLALIKPDAFQRRIEIEEIILKEGGIIYLWNYMEYMFV